MNIEDLVAQIYEEVILGAMDTEEATGMSCQQFFAMQDREKRQFLAEKVRNGMVFHNLKPEEHTMVMQWIFDSTDRETPPDIARRLQVYGEQAGKPSDWAEKAASRANSKKTGETLREQAGHQVILDLREAGMYTQTNKSAIQSASYIGKAHLIFTGSQTARRLRRMEQQIKELQAGQAKVEREAADARARLASLEDWQAKVDAWLGEGKPVSWIAKEVGRSRDSINSYIRRSRVGG